MLDTAEPVPGQQAVLVIADRGLTAAEIDTVMAAAHGNRICLLDLSAAEDIDVGPLPWERLPLHRLLDLDRFHRELLTFLDRWPKETRVGDCAFAEVFRHANGDSVWWTGPGSLRHPFSGPLVPTLRSVWLTRSAINACAPSRVFICVQEALLNELLVRVAGSAEVDYWRSSAARLPRNGRTGVVRWFVHGLLGLCGLLVWIVVRAVFARAVTRGARQGSDAGPTVVLSGWYPNHVSEDSAGRLGVTYWQRLSEVLREQRPDVHVRYLLHTTTFRFTGWRRMLRPFYTGWGRLRRIDHVLPLPQCFPQITAFLDGARTQLRLMRIYVQFEREGGLSTAPAFAGIDVTPLIVPPLRGAIVTVAKWSRNVAAVARSLSWAGEVRALLVHEEFYPKGMLTIAAGKSLNIPTLGVQHGLVGPQHTVYMPPAGHLDDAPSPDWFAAYGDSTIPVLSRTGAYPEQRIRVVGAPRFDHLITNAPDLAGCRAMFDWGPGLQIVLVTTETYRLSSPIIRALVPMARTRPDCRFVVKLHPHDRDPEAYGKLLLGEGLSNLELVRDQLAERMAACDVLVTGYSTTAIEALLLGKTVVCADFTTFPDRYPFILEGAATGARSATQLTAAVAEALDRRRPTELQRSFLQRHLGPTVNGDAARILAGTIEELFLGEGSNE